MARFSINLNEENFDEVVSVYDLRLPRLSPRHPAELVDIEICLDGHVMKSRFINCKAGRKKGTERVSFYCKERLPGKGLRTVMTKAHTNAVRSIFIIEGQLDVVMLGHIIRISLLPDDDIGCRRVCINRLT